MPTAAEDVARRLRAAGCVFAEEEAALLLAEAAPGPRLDALVARRAAGEPLEQVVGHAVFCGLRVLVAPGVFVPRRRTGLMVREAVALVPTGRHARPVVVDLCCGTGAVGLAVAHAVDVTLHAVDVDPAAVACARRNLAAVGGHATTGDLTAGLPGHLRGAVDVVVANVPYVPTAHVALLPAESRLHEPRAAVDGGPDGLDLVRRVLEESRAWLARPGHVLVEVAEHQVDAASAAAHALGLAARVVRDDELDAVVVVASRP